MTHRKLCPDCGTTLTLVMTSHDSGMWVDEGTNEFHECWQSLRRQLAEAIKRAEKAEADLRQYMAAAQKLCEIFFDIAAKHEPEPSIRRQVDSAVQAAKEKA